MRSLIFASLLLLGTVLARSWKDGDLESFVYKDRSLLERTYGAVAQLKRLLDSKAILRSTYSEELRAHMKNISAFLDFEITTEKEVDEVFDFFVTGNQAYSKSAHTSGVMTFINVIVIIAIIAVTISAGYFILPKFIHVQDTVKAAVLYILAVGILAAAKLFCPVSFQNFVATLGALTLGGAYVLTLAILDNRAVVQSAFALVPPLVAWGFLTIYFHTKVIGFIVVLVFVLLLTFGLSNGPFLWMFHGQRDYVLVATLASGSLVALNIAYMLKAPALDPKFIPYIELFEPGILTLGTFGFYFGLLSLSSYNYTQKDIAVFNVIAIAVGLLSFYLGSLNPALTLFRGVSAVFLVAFLLLKWFEIRWGRNWVFGVFGGGLLVIGVCFFIKANSQLFAFS